MTTALPTYEQAQAAVDAGTASALARFIYEHEPAGADDAEFRAGLAEVIAEARASVNRLKGCPHCVCGCEGCGYCG